MRAGAVQSFLLTTDCTDLTDNMRSRYPHKSFPYPRYPRHPRCNQQEFQVSSGTKPKIPFLQCHFHLRRITHITTDCTDLTDNMRSRYPHKSFPYPRYPLREFTPCAPGRCNSFYSLLIAHRLIVFATDRMDVAEAATGPFRRGWHYVARGSGAWG